MHRPGVLYIRSHPGLQSKTILQKTKGNEKAGVQDAVSYNLICLGLISLSFDLSTPTVFVIFLQVCMYLCLKKLNFPFL